MSLTVTNKPADVVFNRYVAEAPTKINMTVDSEGKEGKSHFALTAPGPTAYHDLDFGLNGVGHKFPDLELYYFPYEFSSTNRLPGADLTPVLEKAIRVWKEIATNVIASADKCRSVVIDQGTRLWDVIRIARLGKLTQIPALKYVEVNAEMDDFIQRLHRSPANIIWLHRMKSVYVNNEETDKMERAGYKGIGYDVDVTLLPQYSPKEGFSLTFGPCRTNRALQGTVLRNEEVTFQRVATAMYPTTAEDQWK